MPVPLDLDLVLNLVKMSEDSLEMYYQHRDSRGGVWSMPPLSNTSWNGDLFDFTTMADVFSRNNLDERYELAIETSVIQDDPDAPGDLRGTLADIAAIKAQTGYLSQRERAFRARHTTPILASCHAAARRRGHGQNDTSSTGVFGTVLNAMEELANYGR